MTIREIVSFVSITFDILVFLAFAAYCAWIGAPARLVGRIP